MCVDITIWLSAFVYMCFLLVVPMRASVCVASERVFLSYIFLFHYFLFLVIIFIDTFVRVVCARVACACACVCVRVSV